MMITRSDLCQGHGGGTDCTYHPETGDCDHGYDWDHGVTSYCDGSCASAHEAWLDELERNPWRVPEGSEHIITLDVRGHGRNPESYRVVFTGRDAEARALAYIAPRRGYYFTEAPDAPFHGAAFPELVKVLYPLCHHEMDAHSCMDPVGPNHFGTREWEMAQYGEW